MLIIPNSNGEDNSPSRLREFNRCHNPAGPGGGQFCSAPDAGSGGGPAAPIRQRGVTATPVTEQTVVALHSLGEATQQLDYLKQHHPDLVAASEALVARGHAAQAEFKQDLTEVASQLGYQLHHDIESRDILEKDTDWVVVGPVKGLKRTATKAALEYLGDVGEVKDVLRGTIAVRDARGMVNALSQLTSTADIINIKDHVNKPLASGYRDLNVLIRLRKSGMLAEVQLITKPMLEAKMTVGHKLYEAMRGLAAGSPAYSALLMRQAALYSAAWAKSTNGAAAALLLATLVPRLLGRAV